MAFERQRDSRQLRQPSVVQRERIIVTAKRFKETSFPSRFHEPPCYVVVALQSQSTQNPDERQERFPGNVYLSLFAESVYPGRTMQLDQAYNALGLPWAASKSDVRKAYRRLIRTWHPDRNGHPSASTISARINRAYEALAETDLQPGERQPDISPDASTSERLRTTRQRKAPRRSRPAFHNLFLTFEQGARGGIFEFNAETADICQHCEGFTTVTTEFPCEPCAGTGELEIGHEKCACPDCQGTGVMLTPCPACSGSGLGRTANFRFKAIIPKGVRGGELYRFRAMGKSSGDARIAAEAIVRVHVIKHALFGFDPLGRLCVTVPRPQVADERVMIPTLSGPRPLRVPTPDVREALVKGHGYPERDGTVGDLVVRFA